MAHVDNREFMVLRLREVALILDQVEIRTFQRDPTSWSAATTRSTIDHEPDGDG